MQKTSFTFNQATSPVYKFGSGPKGILVLHGWGSSIKSWSNLLTQFDPQKFTTYFLELPGFGESTEPNTAWNVDNYVSFVEKFVSELPTPPAYLLVHSFGGRLAIKWLALKSNHSFTKAIFIGAAGIKPRLNFRQKITQTVAPFFKSFAKIPGFKKFYNFVRRLVYKFIGSSDYLNVEGTMKNTFINVIGEDLRGLLNQIKIPVRLIWGKHDSFTPLWMGQVMKNSIKNSELIVLDDAKHGLHLQKPEVLVQNVADFFN